MQRSTVFVTAMDGSRHIKQAVKSRISLQRQGIDKHIS